MRIQQNTHTPHTLSNSSVFRDRYRVRSRSCIILRNTDAHVQKLKFKNQTSLVPTYSCKPALFPTQVSDKHCERFKYRTYRRAKEYRKECNLIWQSKPCDKYAREHFFFIWSLLFTSLYTYEELKQFKTNRTRLHNYLSTLWTKCNY